MDGAQRERVEELGEETRLAVAERRQVEGWHQLRGRQRSANRKEEKDRLDFLKTIEEWAKEDKE